MAAVATAAIMSLLTHGSERLGGAASEGIAHCGDKGAFEPRIR